jgi:hypothetical protein
VRETRNDPSDPNDAWSDRVGCGIHNSLMFVFEIKQPMVRPTR